MQHIMTCTTQELALLVTMCGYPSEAKTIAEASLGEKTEQEWLAIMEAAAHQLMAKQYWDYDKEARDEIPLNETMQQFIHTYVQSTYMLRCSNASQLNVLLFHYVKKNTPWIVHIIDRDIVHEFSYIEQQDISALIGDYYDYNNNSLDIGRYFTLSDEAFDLLHDRQQIERIKDQSHFTIQEQNVFQLFTADLKENEWTVNNISLFAIPETEEPNLINIVFFMPSSSGVWIIEYVQDTNKPVLIKLCSTQEWQNLLRNIGQVELN